MRTVLEILNEISATKKRTEKEKIIRELDQRETQAMKQVVFMAYDPSLDYYIKEFEPQGIHDGSITLYEALRDLEVIIAGRQFTGNLAKRWVEMTHSELSEADAEVFTRVIQGDLKCGAGAKTFNKIWPNHVYIHPYMRCSSFKAKNLENISYPCYSQTKMDGLYFDLIIDDKGNVEYKSRSGEKLPFNQRRRDAQLKQKCRGVVLQGEALIVDEQGRFMPREEGNGVINSNDFDLSRLRLVVWDAVKYEDFLAHKSDFGYQERWDITQKLVTSIGQPWIQIVDTRICYNQDDIINHFREKREKGEEGTVIKDYKGKWKNGESKHQIKVKVVFDCDLKVVDFKEGKNKYTGQLGSLICTTSDGLLKVGVGGGYSDEQREAFMPKVQGWIDNEQIVCVRANDVTESDEFEGKMSLFLPRFVEIRHDKSEADTYEKVKEQVRSFTDALQLIS